MPKSFIRKKYYVIYKIQQNYKCQNQKNQSRGMRVSLDLQALLIILPLFQLLLLVDAEEKELEKVENTENIERVENTFFNSS